MSSFADASAVHPRGDGSYDTTIHDGWDIAGNANGGYLLAMAVRAMHQASGRDTPLTVNAHYLRPGRPGPARVDTEILKAGKSFTTVRGQLEAGDGAVISLLGTFGSHTPGAPEHTDGTPPELPDFEECSPMGGGGEGAVPMGFGERVDIRFAPDETFLVGVKSDRALLEGWFAFAGASDEAIDPLGLLVAADSFPPVAFRLDIPLAWVPTLELTVHIRGLAAPGPLRCRFATRFVAGGFLEEDGEVWDSAGRLVAQSRQLALMPRG